MSSEMACKEYETYKEFEYCRLSFRKDKDTMNGVFWVVIDDEDDIIRMRFTNNREPDEDLLKWAENYLPRNVKI